MMYIIDIPQNLSSKVLLNRPDVIEAEQKLVAAYANIGAARAAFFPNISLSGYLGTANNSFEGLFTSQNQSSNYNFSLSIPLLGQGLQESLDAAKARQEEALGRYEKIIQESFSEVYIQTKSRETYRKEFISNEKLVVVEEENVDFIKKRYNSGYANYSDLLLSQQEYFKAEIAKLDSRKNQLLANILLYKALGGGGMIAYLIKR